MIINKERHLDLLKRKNGNVTKILKSVEKMRVICYYLFDSES